MKEQLKKGGTLWRFGTVFLIGFLVLFIALGTEKIAADSAASVGDEMLSMVEEVQGGFSPAFLVIIILALCLAVIMVYHVLMREKKERFLPYWILAAVAIIASMYIFNLRMEEPMIVLRSDSSTIWELRKIFNNMVLYYGGAYIIAIFAIYSAFIRKERAEGFFRAGIILVLFAAFSAIRIPLSLRVFSIGVSGIYHPLWMLAEGIILGIAAGKKPVSKEKKVLQEKTV